jgi:hypothetical protein
MHSNAWSLEKDGCPFCGGNVTRSTVPVNRESAPIKRGSIPYGFYPTGLQEILSCTGCGVQFPVDGVQQEYCPPKVAHLGEISI